MKNKKLRKELIDYLVIAIAMFLGSFGWVVFLLPNQVTIGGIPGISSILYWGFHIPVEVTYFVVNLTLLLVALKVLGWRFCVKTIYSVILFTFFVSVMQEWTANQPRLLADQPFMATIVGAALLGLTVGLGLSSNGSTGGSDVVAAMVNKYYDISLGYIIMLCDVCVVTSSYLVLHSWEKVIYGYVVLFIVSISVDKVVNMMRRSVQFFIISDKHEELGKAINGDVNRGCTVINGKGFYSGKEVCMLFVLAKQNESQKIFRIIDEIDPNAFVSQSAVIGVYGLGFDHVKSGKKKKEKSSNQKKSPIIVK